MRQSNDVHTLVSENEFSDEVLKWLQPDGHEFPYDHEESRHLGSALRSMVEAGNLDEDGPARNAALFVADRLVDCLGRHTHSLNSLREVARKNLSTSEMK